MNYLLRIRVSVGAIVRKVFALLLHMMLVIIYTYRILRYSSPWATIVSTYLQGALDTCQKLKT
jgi:hypothetical protein